VTHKPIHRNGKPHSLVPGKETDRRRVPRRDDQEWDHTEEEMERGLLRPREILRERRRRDRYRLGILYSPLGYLLVCGA
jgi:hypothetical protein